MRRLLATISALGLLSSHSVLAGEDVLVAVASNFVATAEELVEAFNEASEYRARLSPGQRQALTDVMAASRKQRRRAQERRRGEERASDR